MMKKLNFKVVENWEVSLLQNFEKESPKHSSSAVLTVRTGLFPSVCHLTPLTPQPSITAMKQ